MGQIVHPVILCGGAGTRLWPLSTPATPKQFLALTSDKSMITETADRFASSHEDAVSFGAPLVVGSAKHQALLADNLPNARQILEPFGRNSAPAVAAACLAYQPDDLILILSADHSIRNVPAFHRAIVTAANAAARGAIVTFGIKPTYAATGYGYIKAAGQAAPDTAIAVEQFVEKPPLADAEAYLKAGTYFWNAGIFLFKASSMLEALKAHAPDVLAGTEAAMGDGARETILLDADAFEQTPSISIDFAVMEHAKNVETVPVDMDWSDVGGYPALHELLADDPQGNAVTGRAVIRDSSGLYVRSDGPVISVSGVSNLAIVATGDDVMITPIDDANAVKALGKEVQQNRHTLGLSQDLIDQARDWLWTTFEVWSEKAWDPDLGGFVEQLSMEGEPDRAANRRVRVQARQVFSFAKAIEMGWPGADKARALVDKGIDYIDTKLRHPEGGWVHTIEPNGTPIDEKRDLYDHAFMILAGATAYQITGNETALKIADDAIAFIDSELKDHAHGGWFEAKPAVLPRRANPHMHLLEAMMAYHEATGCQKALERAAEVVRLFETKFFNPANDVMAEFFANDWSLETPEDQVNWEPGHHYEWATLLFQYEQITGHDSASWRRRLIKRADESGINPETGFAYNAVRADGHVVDSNSRLWHQLERFRTVTYERSFRYESFLTSMIANVFTTYLNAGPRGGWVDEVECSKLAQSFGIPASMLYHAFSAFENIL
ncbi:MAG: AGE family epimerase/isomerase [Pseudomonadota bacterium]